MDNELFHVEINNGRERVLDVKTTIYSTAAVAALALFEYERHPDYDVVKIWCPRLLPDYGPYFYAWDGFTLGTPDKSRQW